MEATDSLNTIAEVAIALAGFSGLAAVFRSQPFQAWAPRERFAFWLIFVCSLGALFFALIPSAFHYFGLSERVTWRSASLLMLLWIAGVLVAAVIADRRMNRTGHPRAWPFSWRVGAPTAFLAAILQFMNAIGLVITPGPGPYYVALIAMLALGAMNFILLLMFPHDRS